MGEEDGDHGLVVPFYSVVECCYAFFGFCVYPHYILSVDGLVVKKCVVYGALRRGRGTGGISRAVAIPVTKGPASKDLKTM